MSQKIRPNNKQKQGDILMSQANADIKAKNLRNTIFGGLDTTIPFGGYSYKARGFDKAATEGNWSKWSLPEDMVQKAYEEQDWKETIIEMGIGFGKQLGAGFLDSIGAWDASNITQSTYRNGEIEYSNWLNQLGAKLKKSAQEENQIYQDPSGSMWNGAYFANQVQQLGYTGGIIAEMVAENILLNTLTGGTTATATTAKGARLFANIGKDALFGMGQGIKEAHMNALETQNTVFQKFKQLGYTDEEALAKSKEAANLHFKTESTALMVINALQNVMFLGSLSRGAKNIAKNAFNREGDKLSLGISDAFQNVGEKVIGAITPNKTVQKLTGWGLLAGSEAIEEGVQTGIGVYASNKVQGKETTIDDLMTHEMRDSVFGGALGGVLLGAGFKAITNYTNRDFNKNYKNFLEDSINFSHNTLRAEDEARKNYNQIVKEFEANPSESNAKKLLNFKDELEKAKHNSSVATAFMSLNFDYAKGTGSTVAFDMHVAHMQNVLEAVNTGNTEQLKNYGLLDEDTGKERFAGSLETIKNTYQDNIDNALQVKKFFSETLGKDTNDFKVASDIVLAKFNRFQTQKRNNKIDEELNTAYNADEVFKSLSSNSQKRFKLENELTGINKYVSDQDNPLVQQRKQEIKEELDNLPDYSVEEKAFISFDTSRDTGYATAYGNKMNLLLGINSATKEIAELSNPDNIKNRVKTNVEETLNKATTKEEIDSAIQEAKYHGVHTNKMDEVAKAKLKSIKASEAAAKAAGVTTSTPKAQLVEPVTKPVEEKVEKPNPNMQKAVSILGGKKFETSGIESTVAETLDNAITANTESLAQDAFSDPNTAQELKDTFSDIYDELQDELGRIPTHDDLVRKFIKAYGKEEVKGYLPGLERASELLGKAITDTSYLFQSLEKGRKLLKNLISNNTPEKENPVNSKHIDDTPNKEIETVERGTGFGANKAAIYNDYNRETGNYRQAEYLPGLPEDNTLRYFLKPGDKLIMALAENYESIHVAIMDRRVPTNVGHSGRTMPFGEFMEWVTTDEATKYGYKKLEKNSPEWKTLWNNKVPMVYHLYNEQTGEPDLRVAALVHDVEWWHRNNVSQISEKDPITIAREGAESTAEERRRFFEEGKRVAEVTEVSQLGTEFYLVKQEADGSWVSNVDTGEMYITLEEATGATRLGVATASNKIKLEDGTELTIGEKHPNTEQPILLNTKSFSEGTIVEVRKIRDINGNPVYKAYTPIIDKAAKGQQLNDTTFNIVKYIILSRIYNKIQSEDIKNYLKTNYNVDVNSIQALENALKESRLGSLEGNIDEVVSSFIMTSNSIDYSQKGNWTQLVLGKDFMKVYYKGKLQSINFNNTAEKSVSNIKEIENFLELLLGTDNDGVLRNTTVNVKKEKLISKGQMFVVDSVGNVQPFQSLHGQNTYAGYLKSIVKTSVKSFPAKELGPNGETQWITDVQPMVYVTNNVEQLKVEQAPIEVVQDSQVDTNDTIEQQRADIERRRQEELDKKRKPLVKGLERLEELLENGVPTNEKDAGKVLNEISRARKNISKGSVATQEELNKLNTLENYIKNTFGLEIVEVKPGTIHNSGNRVELQNITSGTATLETELRDKNGELIRVYTNTVEPQINKNGVLWQAGKYDLVQGISQEELDNIKNPINLADKINAKYDAELEALNNKKTLDINDEIETPEVDINEATVGGITYDKEGLKLLKEIDPEAYELLVNNSTHYFGESEARNEFETQPGELGNLNIPGITAKELNDVGAFLFNSVLGTIEQNDSNTIKPRLIYDRLMSSPEQFLFEKMQNYRRIAENLRANPKFNEAMEPIASRYETNANKLQSIIDNKKVITDVLKLQLDELLGQEFIIDSITEGYINQEGDYVNDVFNEDFEYGEQIETNYSKMSTEKDIRLTYSTALKIAFAGIQVKNHRGDKVSGEFDLPIFEDINSVSETVKALIVGLPSNTNMMLEKLKEVSITAGNKQTANIASEMYNKIKNAPEHVKNEMLYKLAQQKLNMEMVIYSTDNKGRYTLKVQNTNSNADLFRIRDQWRVNFLKSSFVETNKDNEKVLNKEYLKNFYDRVKDLHTNIDTRLLENEKQVQDETFQIFQDLGITIGRNTFDTIWSAGTIIKDKSGFFGILLRQIEPITKKEEELSLDKEDNRFLDSGLNSKLKALAGVELVLNSTLATPSQRIAGKSYPGTSQRIMLDDITDQLFNTRSSLFTFLKGAAYSKRNFLLDIIENTDFLNNIENYYTRVSPIAIKEQGKKDFGDNSIDKIADSDNILATLGFFQHSSKEKLNTTGTNFSYPNIAFRIGKMFSPALSDKGQMVAITTALLDLKKNNFNIEGNKVSLSDDVLDFMLVNLFDSEFDRIVYSYNNPTNIKGYEQANKFFNAIPAFNDIEVGESTLYEVLRETINNPDIEDKQAAFENIRSSVRYNAKEILNRIIEADLNTKIKNNEEGLVTGGTWVKAGILSNSEATENKPSEVALKYIDSKYVSSKEDADLNNLQKGKIAALDFIVNHYLFQSNIYQLYVGDMALYAPGAKKYLAKDGTLDSFNLSNETGQAITKRIASLIAPGNVLANSTLDNGMPAKYIQIFVNDVQAPSSIVEEYIKMVNDGKIPEDQKEHLENYKSEDPVVKNTAIDALKNMNPTIAEYFNIEGTDAQEYTTWQEHLDVLYGQGRITKEDKERFANNIKNDSLTDEDLKIILNPLKPVYAGMLQDTQNEVNRFVYVKSSSFPLLPQLTKGLKLDKVRIAMEKLQEEGQNVRMSYQTANKVGAVNTTLHMSDFYNATPETLNDLIENKIKPNTLVLNRSSFKVQQDTPYKAKKYMEKNKDTQTTLGSQMFKNLMGAGINQMGAVFPNLFPQTILNELGINIPRGAMLTGPQLDSIKTLVETKYMELQSKNLENEIGIVPGQSYFTLPVEKKQQIFKNLIDVLKNEIKTRQYDKALLKELEIDETGLETTIPIWITNNADKFESLFLSIVKNRFISIKLPGNGHIVGSSEGFERIDTLDNLSDDVKSNIVWVDPNHTGDLKATYITTKDGKKVVSESEILVQSHYIVNVKDKTGKIVSKKINLLDDEYSTLNDKGERVLKLDKIDPELLSNFSFRIPTSAHQSGAILKVVGFLPENSGDLLIVPDEHTKQIGEDFDIDKRYVYKSNYKINKETGRIEKISLDNIEELKNLIEEFKLSQDNQDADRLVGALLDTNIGDLAQEIQNEIENLVGKSVSEITTKSNNLKNSILNKLTLAGLENAMIDTYKSVYQSPSEEVQKKIFRILSMDVAEKTANLIDSTINVVDKQNYTFLSDEVQRKQMKSGTSGKLGTAMHSNAVTFQAQMERLKDKLTITFKNEDGETQNKEIRIGDLVSDGVLGITETLDGGREVNAVHAENQNSAVDNVKANIMAKRNENSYTMPVLIQLTFRRFDQVPVTRIVDGKTITTKEHLPSLFLAQPILRRYVELMEESKSITSEFSYNTEATIIEKLYKEFSTPGIDINDNINYMSASEKMTGTELYNNLSGQPNNFIQAGVLRKFLELKAEAEELQDIQRVMSLSSGGLGKSYFDVIDRIERLNALPYSSIKNASKLIGIHTVYDAKLDLEDPEHYKGYIVLGDKAWKPTTSEGAMLLHSLKTAEQIMDINYPYNRNFISRTLNNIIAEKGTPLNANNTTEFKWKVLKSLKDFLQSNSDLNYFVGDIDAERKRLFGNEVTTGFVKTNYKVRVQENTHVRAINPKTGRLEDGIGTLITVDNSKGERILHRAILGNKPVFNKFNQFVQNKNFVIKKEEDGSYTYYNYTQKVVKESLADYLHRIKQERDGRGNLIHPIFASNNLLKSLDIQLNDKYSNNISIIKHANVDAIDFNMLGKNEYFLQMLDDNTTNIGTWNGEQMTPRKLAQDLASYAYLSNQENGAIGFRQFIDTNYLKAIGYDKQLKQVLDKYDSSERIQNTFLKQYYQHNPEQARIISVNNITLDNIVRLDPETNKYRNTNQSPETKLNNILRNVKEFTLVDNDSNEIKTKFIAIRDTSIKYSDNQYRLFEYTGEGTGYVEIPVLGTFGYNEYNQNNYNQTSSLTNKEFSPISIFSGTVVGPNGLWDTFENNIETEDLNDFYNFDSVEVFANTVKQLALNSGVKETIELLEDYLDPRTKIEVINFNDVGRTGQGVYIHETNTILINSESIRQGLNSGLELSEVLERLNSIFTEELLHSVQVNALKQYGTTRIVNHGTHKENVFTPNSDAPVFVTKLVALYNEAKSVLPYVHGQENYESKDIFEFMAGAFDHRSEYRQKLDTIKDSKGKSLMDRFKEIVGQAIQFLTGNYSSEVKQTVIDLMNNTQDLRGRNIAKPVTTTIIKVEGTSSRPDISFVDKKDVQAELDSGGLVSDITELMKNIKDKSLITPENLLSLLQENNIIKKEC